MSVKLNVEFNGEFKVELKGEFKVEFKEVDIERCDATDTGRVEQVEPLRDIGDSKHGGMLRNRRGGSSAFSKLDLRFLFKVSRGSMSSKADSIGLEREVRMELLGISSTLYSPEIHL